MKILSDRAERLGYSCFKDYGAFYTDGIAENLVEGGSYYGDLSENAIAKSSVKSWMESSGHKANILTPTYDKGGFGIAEDTSQRGRLYITQLLLAVLPACRLISSRILLVYFPYIQRVNLQKSLIACCMTVPSASTQQYGIPSVTLDGVNVRSKAEKKIGDFLFLHGIRYEYERVIKQWDIGRSIARPDFYLPEYDLYIEYWGKPEDPEYKRIMLWKLAAYHRRRLNLISLYPHNMEKFDFVFRLKFKSRTGKDFPPLGKDRQVAA